MTFANVLHEIIDHLFSGELADKMHATISSTTGPDTRADEQADATVTTAVDTEAAPATDGVDVPTPEDNP